MHYEQTLRVTAEHPFYREYEGWTPAKSLSEGAAVLGAEGKLTVVENKIESHPNGVTVYNLEFAGRRKKGQTEKGSEANTAFGF